MATDTRPDTSRPKRLRRVLAWSAVIVLVAVAVVGFLAWRWIDGLAGTMVSPPRPTLEHDIHGAPIRQGGPPPGSLGILTRTADEGGEQVVRVAGPPGTTMGIRRGDVVVEWNGTLLDGTGEAYRKLREEARAGDAASLRVKRPAGGSEALLEVHGALSPAYRNPADLDLAYESVEFVNPDGTTLRGWYVAAPGDRGVVFAHGNGMNRTFGLYALGAFHDAGYHAMLFDFGGRGDSDGDVITYGVREAGDLRAAVAELSRRSGVPASRVVLFGLSMGAASALLAASQTEVGAVVSCAAYADLSDALRSTLNRMGLPVDDVPSPLVSAVRRKAGFDLREIRPVEAVPRIRAPVLYVHGEADLLIPPEHTERLAAVTKTTHEVLSVPEMSHVHPSRFLGEAFMDTVLAFLDRNGLAPLRAPPE